MKKNQPNTFGFIVQPDEIRPRWQFDEGMDGTIFVDVYIVNEADGKLVAHFYYARNFAKHNAVTIDELKLRFPKSFSFSNSSEEYTKLFDAKCTCCDPVHAGDDLNCPVNKELQ